MVQALEGKVAIVTGGGKGIGRAIAVGLSKERATVVVTGRTSTDIEATVTRILAAKGNAVSLRGDVRRSEDVNMVVSETLRRFGQIDILVNNAGIDGSTKPFVEVEKEELTEVLDVNLNGVFLFSKAVLPHMISRHQGNVVNLSSGAGVRSAKKRVRSVTYMVSKFALEGLTFAMAGSLIGTGVNVNALKPGYLLTSFQRSWSPEQLRKQAEEFGEPRKPEAVVPVAVYLASLAPGELTGESISAKDWYASRGIPW